MTTIDDLIAKEKVCGRCGYEVNGVYCNTAICCDSEGISLDIEDGEPYLIYKEAEAQEQLNKMFNNVIERMEKQEELQNKLK